MALLEVSNLDVRFALRQGEVRALRDVSFTLDRGERLGIVGESGAGKSVAAFTLLNLIAKPGYIADGSIRFEGNDLARMSARELRRVRGNRISMIFQDPMMTLNPVLSIGEQMVESLKAHRRISTREARAIALHKLKQVYIPSPETRLDQYPHELSGGMRQRIIIAIALLLDPDIIVADEPTTALDVTIQAEIMTLLRELCEKHNVGLVLITHDLGVVSQMTQRTLVMYAGRVIEQGPTLHTRLAQCSATDDHARQSSQSDSRLDAITCQYTERLCISSTLPISLRRFGGAAPRLPRRGPRVRHLGKLRRRVPHGA